MPWSKGAVVIKKHGDQDWADAMAKTLDIQRASNKEVEELREENKELKRDNEFMKKHIVESLEVKMANAELQYGHKWTPPKWAKRIMEGFAFIVYHVSLFIEKYLIL